ncbi:MAG TPA: polysaccharide biosynthesis tyrosine autokinase [Candidatus Binatia bacterium]|nr:polysaccharide biosynthesis tyrosine autokinase [Candidatus Binatia bacterium]
MRVSHHARVALPPPPGAELEFEAERPRHLRDYVGVVLRHFRLAATCFAATVLLALLVTLVMPRRYTASTRLQLARQSPIQLRLQNNVISLDDGDRGDRAAITFVGTQATALESRDLAERVIRGYGLAESPAFLEPSKHRSGALPVTREVKDLFQPRGLDAGAPDSALRALGPTDPLDPELLDRYMRYLSVRQLPGTDLIDVTFVTPSPTLSAFLAAAHTQAYLEANEDARRATDTLAQGFLGHKLGEARKRVKVAEESLAKFASRHPDVAVDGEHQIGGQRIAELSSLLTKAEATRVGLESRYEFLTGKSGDPAAYFAGSPAVEKLRLALLDVRAQRAGFDGRLGDNHPRMIELRRLESEIGSQLKTEVAQGVAAVRAHYAAAREREDQLRRKLEQQQEIGTEMNRQTARYALLKNDVETARSLHTSLLEQQMATAANANLGATNVRVVERAEVPQHPSRPKLPLNLAIGLAGGLVVGLGAAFARDYFDQSVRSTVEVEQLLRLPTLATIPNFALGRQEAALPPPANGRANGHAKRPSSPHGELVVFQEPDSPVAEAFRGMRTALLFSRERTPRVIAVSSARAAEGKTVASMNLVTALAQSGARVLLIEADLRHPRCHRILGLYNVPGLSNFLSGESDDLDAMIGRVDPPGFHFLPSGALPANPAELLGSRRMRELLRRMRKVYDHVVLDTPPILPVTDAVVLGGEADGVVLVVKGNDTPRELVRRAHDRLVQARVRMLGVLVNNVDLAWGDPYFYESYYGYRGRPDGTETVAGAERARPAASQHHPFPAAAAWMKDVAFKNVARFARDGVARLARRPT